MSLGLIYVAVCWGLNTVLVKVAVTAVPPMAFTLLRFAAMTPLVFALVAATGKRIHIHKRDIPLLVTCGACGFGVYQYLWVIGLSHTTAFASALLGTTTPVWTLAILAATRHERIRSGRWIGALVALLGIAIFEGAFAGKAQFRLGDVLTVFAAISFGAYNVVTARLLDRYGPLELVAIAMAIGTIAIVPGGVIAMTHTDWSATTPSFWGIYLYAVFFPIVLTYPVFSAGINLFGAAHTSLFGFLVPIIAGIASSLLFHAFFAPYEIIGTAVCLGGMVAAQLFGTMSLRSMWAARTLPSADT